MLYNPFAAYIPPLDSVTKLADGQLLVINYHLSVVVKAISPTAVKKARRAESCFASG